MKNKKILYIGNNLTQKTKYNSTMTVLSSLLSKEGYDVRVSSDKINKIPRLFDMVLTTLKYRNKVDYVLIDTYSTINFYYAFVIAQLARVFRLRYIPILHGGNLPQRISKSSFLANRLFKNSYKNIAPSHYLKDEFEHKGYESTVIPNILEVDHYIYRERKEINPKLFWVRAFKEIYNPTLVIKVLKLVKKEFPKAILCMVGPFVDDSYTKTLTLVEGYNLEDSVEFTDVLRKEAWHKKSVNYDIFINTTNFDNTPVSVMEAMALGLPVVSTNVGGLPYLIENKKDGLLVNKENPKEMAAAIIDIVLGKHPNLAIEARKKVEGFSWSANKDKWLKTLR